MYCLEKRLTRQLLVINHLLEKELTLHSIICHMKKPSLFSLLFVCLFVCSVQQTPLLLLLLHLRLLDKRTLHSEANYRKSLVMNHASCHYIYCMFIKKKTQPELQRFVSAENVGVKLPVAAVL